MKIKATKIIPGPVEVGGQLTDHYHGPTRFDLLVDWGRKLDRFRNYQTPPSQKWRKDNLPDEVEILEWQQRDVGQFMDQLTWLANQPDAYENKMVKLSYRDALGEVYRFIGKNNINHQALPLGIIRAGGVAARLLHPDQDALLINMKRLPFKDGGFKVGIIDENRVLKTNFRGKVLEIDEVFLASGLTIASLLLTLRLYSNLPAKVVIIAPFTTQVGAEWLLSLARELGIELRLIAARLYWYLDENLYVWEDPERRIYHQLAAKGVKPIFAGGDAGDLTEV